MAPRKPKAAPAKPAAEAIAEELLYGSEYDALVSVLGTPSFRKALANYCNARRVGAGQMVLLPNQTMDQIQIIRGKTQAFFELLAMCESARVADDDDENEGE